MDPKAQWGYVAGVGIIIALFSTAGLIAYLLYGPGITINIPTWFKTATSTRQSSLTGIPGTLFECGEGKALKAEFLQGSVNLALSDGRQIRLPETIAASGTRYANTNESFVLWHRDNIVSVEENGITAYANCVANQ